MIHNVFWFFMGIFACNAAYMLCFNIQQSKLIKEMEKQISLAKSMNFLSKDIEKIIKKGE